MVEIMEEAVLFLVMVVEVMAERWCWRCGTEELWDGRGRGI